MENSLISTIQRPLLVNNKKAQFVTVILVENRSTSLLCYSDPLASGEESYSK